MSYGRETTPFSRSSRATTVEAEGFTANASPENVLPLSTICERFSPGRIAPFPLNLQLDATKLPRNWLIAQSFQSENVQSLKLMQ